jgi:hypothetical protein
MAGPTYQGLFPKIAMFLSERQSGPTTTTPGPRYLTKCQPVPVIVKRSIFQHHTTLDILRNVSNDMDLFTITGTGWHFVKYLGPGHNLVWVSF